MTALAHAAEEWSRIHRVRAGRWNVRYRQAGEGPALVLVHGLGLSADFWMRNGAPLAAAGFRVLAPDLPGFGRTEGPVGLSIPAQAEAVAEWADALALGPAAYVGHSISCQTILQLAADDPQRATALVLAAPTGDPRPFRLTRQAVGFAAAVFVEPPDLIPAVGEPYLRAGVVRWLRTWIAGGRHDVLPLAERVRAPSLVVIGRRDTVVRPAFARGLAEALPAGRVAVAEHGAHGVV
ncbi:MAG TPA: alpha/beta fold hydrolase, partial [Longimicrobium sp.]|nr:alpha/beta fold hydrolase [Longimicrobium sp.]